MQAGEHTSYTSNLQIDSRLLPKNVVPDGNLEKEIWRRAERTRLDYDWAGRKTQIDTQVASFWTPSHIYFAFWCNYSALNIYEGEDSKQERWGLWDRDVVEVFLNPKPRIMNHYYEFEVAPNNLWIDLEINLEKKPFNDAAWDSHFQHATRIDSQHHLWTCEMSLPVASMKVARVRANTKWRINFYRADGRGDDSHRHFLCWSPVLGEKPNFHVPARFGIIRFLG